LELMAGAVTFTDKPEGFCGDIKPAGEDADKIALWRSLLMELQRDILRCPAATLGGEQLLNGSSAIAPSPASGIAFTVVPSLATCPASAAVVQVQRVPSPPVGLPRAIPLPFRGVTDSELPSAGPIGLVEIMGGVETEPPSPAVLGRAGRIIPSHEGGGVAVYSRGPSTT